MKEYLASLLKYLLLPLSILYGIIIFVRNKCYDIGLLSSIKFDAIPVINVGNLSVGGTGKTPHIEYLIRLLLPKFHTATLSRGYRRYTKGFRIADAHSTARDIGDEPFQFKRKFENLLVAVGEDRVTAIPELLQRAPFLECVLMDDAFQHRSVIAGCNILITEYAKPYPKDFILPFGRLREGRQAAKRADIIIVSKCPTNVSEADKQNMLRMLQPEEVQKVFFSTIVYDQPYDLFGGPLPSFNIETSALVISGIANAQPFIDKIKTLTKEVHELEFADHHYFTADDINDLKASFDYLTTKNKCIFVTEKDATRLVLHEQLIRDLQLPIVVIPIHISFLFNEGQHFDKLVNEFVHSFYPLFEAEPEIIYEEII